MSNIDIELCSNFIKNKFDLVLISANRAKDISFKKALPFVKSDKDKPTVIALKEISSGFNITLQKNSDLNSDNI